MNEPDMSWYPTARNKRLVSQAHVVRPGLPGLDCLAGQEPAIALLDVHDGMVCCSACGNELGREDQLMVKVWDDRNVRVHGGGTAHLAFLG